MNALESKKIRSTWLSYLELDGKEGPAIATSWRCRTDPIEAVGKLESLQTTLMGLEKHIGQVESSDFSNTKGAL